MRPDGAYAYVMDSALLGGTPDVDIIDTATHLVIATIPMGLDPQQLAFIPGSSLAYIANQLSNNIFVIGSLTNAYVSSFLAGTGPVGLAITP